LTVAIGWLPVDVFAEYALGNVSRLLGTKIVGETSEIPFSATSRSGFARRLRQNRSMKRPGYETVNSSKTGSIRGGGSGDIYER